MAGRGTCFVRCRSPSFRPCCSRSLGPERRLSVRLRKHSRAEVKRIPVSFSCKRCDPAKPGALLSPALKFSLPQSPKVCSLLEPRSIQCEIAYGPARLPCALLDSSRSALLKPRLAKMRAAALLASAARRWRLRCVSQAWNFLRIARTCSNLLPNLFELFKSVRFVRFGANPSDSVRICANCSTLFESVRIDRICSNVFV